MHSKDLNKKNVLIFAIFVAINLYNFTLKYIVAADIFFLFFAVISHVSVKMDRKTKIIFKNVLWILLYTLIVSVANQEFSSYTIGKPLRLLLFLYIYNIAGNIFYKFSEKEIDYGLALALLINVIFIYIEFFVPSTKDVIYSLLDTDKELKDVFLRSFGLYSSYDFTGLCVNILMLYLYILIRKTKNVLLTIPFVGTFIASFLVSRLTMMVSSMISFLFLFEMYKRQRKTFLFLVFPIIGFIGYQVYEYAIILIDSVNINESYNESSFDILKDSMLFFPDSILECLFGTGLTQGGSDIGYVKLVFMIGIIGTVMILRLYIKGYKMLPRVSDSYARLFLFSVMILLFAYNSKLLFLCSRGISDLFFLLLIIYYKKAIYEKKNYTCSIQ